MEVETPVLQPLYGGAFARAVRDAPPLARPDALSADRRRALPQAAHRRRVRAGLRDRQGLPQRGNGPDAQPGVHAARALPGLRGLQRHDGADRGAVRAHRARGFTAQTSFEYGGTQIDLKPSVEAAPRHGRRRARPSASTRSPIPTRSSRPPRRKGVDIAAGAAYARRAVEKILDSARRAEPDGAHVPHRLPEGDLAAGEAARRTTRTSSSGSRSSSPGWSWATRSASSTTRTSSAAVSRPGREARGAATPRRTGWTRTS